LAAFWKHNKNDTIKFFRSKKRPFFTNWLNFRPQLGSYGIFRKRNCSIVKEAPTFQFNFVVDNVDIDQDHHCNYVVVEIVVLYEVVDDDYVVVVIVVVVLWHCELFLND
jgi:hypothetical protein